MLNNKSTKQGHKPTPPQDPETLVRFAELLKLRDLAPGTQEEYLRFVRKLTARTCGDATPPDFSPPPVYRSATQAHMSPIK